MAELMRIPIEIRDRVGKGVARKLRRQGKIPGIVYGPGQSPVPIALDPRYVVSLLERGAAENTLLELDAGNGQKFLCLLKDYQLEPVYDRIIHVDFYAIKTGVMLTLRVPLRIVGEAPGVKAGGILEFLIREIAVECLPKDIPEFIPVDISHLGIGDFIQVKDLSLPEGVRAVEDPDEVVVTIAEPEEYQEEEEVPALVETPEPEVIRKGKVEAEEEGES